MNSPGSQKDPIHWLIEYLNNLFIPAMNKECCPNNIDSLHLETLQQLQRLCPVTKQPITHTDMPGIISMPSSVLPIHSSFCLGEAADKLQTLKGMWAIKASLTPLPKRSCFMNISHEIE